MKTTNIIALLLFMLTLAACGDSQETAKSSVTTDDAQSATQTKLATSDETKLSNGSSLDSVLVTCSACHSDNGIATNPEWPNLAGQNVDYLALQLREFRDGKRANALMAQSLLSGFSDQDLNVIAKHYSQLPPVKADDSSTTDVRDLPGAHVRARCVSCHGMTGNPVTSVWPNIAGQNAAYTAKQLRDYKSGARSNPIMSVIVNELTDQQIIDVAEYYQLAK